jgi:hypothetical protein
MTTSYKLSQYKGWVRDRLPGLTLADSLLTEIANAVNREICNAEPWPFKEQTFSGTAASGTREYDLSITVSTLQLPRGLQLTDPDSSAVSVKYMPYQRFYQLYPDPDQLTATRPWLWSIIGSILIIGPAKMDQTYTFRLPYIKEPTPLTADGNVVDVPDAFAEVFITGMMYRAYQSKRKFNQAQVIRQDYDGADDKHNGGLFGDMKRRLLVRQDGELTEVGHGRQYTHLPSDPYSYYDT